MTEGPAPSIGSGADLALRRSEERLRQVVEAAPNAMVMIDGSGRIVMVNAQAERLFLYPRAELLGKPVELLLPERFRAGHPALRGAFLATPEARPMGAGRDLFGRKKDGTEFPIEIGLNPIETDEGTMVLSAILDITERKRIEDMLRRGEERLRRVIEGSPSAKLMIDAAGRIVMVNAQAERLFGYPRAELLGQPVEMLVPDRMRAGHGALRGGFFASPQARPMGAGRDLYARRKDGSEVPVEIGLNPIETDEGPMVLSAIADITDRKQKEERIGAALREKEVLLGEIHHRVKNNLQIIHSLLDLQSGSVADDAALAMLTDAKNRVRSMSLIHQTLYQSHDFAKVDFGAFLDELLPTLISSYGVDRSRIALVMSIDAVGLAIDRAIPCGLIVNELISNAMKHAFPDGRSGRVVVALAAEGERVTLSVSDDGVGLPPDWDAAEATTLGLQLVTLLTEQAQAELTINRAQPTSFTLHFTAGAP